MAYSVQQLPLYLFHLYFTTFKMTSSPLTSPLKPSCQQLRIARMHSSGVRLSFRTTNLSSSFIEIQPAQHRHYNRRFLPDCKYHRCSLSQLVVGPHMYLIGLLATCRESIDSIHYHSHFFLHIASKLQCHKEHNPARTT